MKTDFIRPKIPVTNQRRGKSHIVKLREHHKKQIPSTFVWERLRNLAMI